MVPSLPLLSCESSVSVKETLIKKKLVRNNMEPYYPCTWLNFVNQKKWKKKRNWNLLMKIISPAPKVLFFKTADLYSVYLFSEYVDN